ncbi:MAG: HAD family hydrolase [bacterium]
MLLASACCPARHPVPGQPSVGPSAVTGPLLRFKVIYVDLDGTALDGRSQEPRPGTIAALDDFRACGGLVGIATGRSLEQATPYFSSLRPNAPVVLMNGGMIVDPTDSRIITVRRFSKSEVLEAVRAAASVAAASGVAIHLVNGTLVVRPTPGFLGFLRRASITPTGTCASDHCLTGIAQGEIELPVKIMLVVPPGRASTVVASLRTSLGRRIAVSIGNPAEATVELVPAGTDKGAAISTILQRRGLLPERDLLAFGDGQNDAEMLGNAAVGVAMQRSHEDARRRALFVTGSNDSDSIAAVVRRLAITPSCARRVRGGTHAAAETGPHP